MRVFITGGTGLIGSAVLKNLIAHDHKVFALARSENSKNNLITAGATPIMGDITEPEIWCADLPEIDSFIHTACDFSDQMAKIDATLLDQLIPALHRQARPVRLIYTGGIWMYPESSPSDPMMDETTAFAPLPEFQWGIAGINRVLSDEKIDGIILHPACVYTSGEDGRTGHFDRDIDTIKTQNRVTVIGGDEIYQPLVHANDLADLYRLALEKAKPGSSYIGSTIHDLSNRAAADLIARHFGSGNTRVETITAETAMARLGDWARGLAHSQHFSSAKAQRELGWNPKHRDIEDAIRTIKAQKT
ncbi:NAD-dependent epimerase/dehydratase family protein [Thalassospira sp.]|uniref:NAD-dependent epimerase/dehydratase family protein n=1 Tax=Thalassospira sp. TaxID=1912094 RepID=UPI0032EBED09